MADPHEAAQAAIDALPKPTTKEALLTAVCNAIEPEKAAHFSKWFEQYGDMLLKRVNG